jgi:preprotein translocase subunit SecG
MYAFLSFIHVADCVLLIIAVLMQSSKGGGLAGAFGGQSTQAVFGGRGAGTFLSRATTVLAIVFMLTSLVLTMQGGRGSARRSALATQAQKEGVAVPFSPQGALPQPGAQGQDAGTPPLGADAVPPDAPPSKTTSPEEPAVPPPGGGS